MFLALRRSALSDGDAGKEKMIRWPFPSQSIFEFWKWRVYINWPVPGFWCSGKIEIFRKVENESA